VVIALWAAVFVMAIGFAILAYEFWGLPRRRYRVLVNFRDPTAPALDGILWQRRGRWLVMRDCALLETAKATPTRVDGEVILDRSLVLFLQVPGDRR
jgi:hypothetical protein